MSVQSAGGSARRSRRGYYYQDLYALRCCLRMLRGEWEVVLPEGDEDVVCSKSAPEMREYVQVKTVEQAGQHWTQAALCRPEGDGQPATSILGRLFVGKDLRFEVSFVVATNEGIAQDLRPLRRGDAHADRTEIVSSLEGRLAGVQPSNGRSVHWCLEHLWIDVCEHSADGLEAQLLREIHRGLAPFGIALLPDEAEQLLDGLVNEIARRSRNTQPLVIRRDEFRTLIVDGAQGLVAATTQERGSASPSLEQKLRAARFADEQIRDMERMRLAFTRFRRHAVSRARMDIDELSDEIAIACHRLMARRRSGELPAGAAAFEATAAEVARIHDEAQNRVSGLTLSLAHGALHDITGRCGNEYA